MSRCRPYHKLVHGSVEGELAPADALKLAGHVHVCTACRILLARESRLASMLDGLPDAVEVDERFFRSVMASLPERAPVPAALATRRLRLRRGLKLAGFTSLAALAGAAAARVVPSLRFDLASPAMPRFSPEDADGWLSVFGSAAQWVKVTAQSLAWASSPEALSPRALGVLSLETAMLSAAAVLAISGALMLTARDRSRAS
jgi:hypothetical protein